MSLLVLSWSYFPNRTFVETCGFFLRRSAPGVTIVQGPDGDELTINGQKGINNNISVDGADFNNPFFGEQRGGQRPAFTFNLDAVQEMVVVADGANAEFGRSASGFVNVVTKSGTNDDPRHRPRLLQGRQPLRRAPKNADGSAAHEVPVRARAGRLHARRADRRRTSSFYFLAARRPAAARSTKQTDPSRIEQRVVDFFASLGSPDENGPIERTNDARVFLGKVDWQLDPKHLATLRYNYTWSEQENGTFDVDSWGRSANAVEKDYSQRRHRLADLDALGDAAQRVPLPVRARGSAAALRRARHHRPEPAAARHRLRLRPRSYRFGEPFFIPVEYYDTRFQFNDNISLLTGSHAIKVGVEYNRVNSVQTFLGFANGRYIFGSTDGFLNYARNPNYVECSNGTTSQTGACPAGHRRSPARAALPAAGRRRRPLGRGGGHADDPAERARGVHPGQVAADAAT